MTEPVEIPPELIEKAEQEGFDWKPAAELTVGDFLRTERFHLTAGEAPEIVWLELVDVDVKPKTVWISADTGTMHGVIKSRPRHDDVFGVKSADAMAADRAAARERFQAGIDRMIETPDESETP